MEASSADKGFFQQPPTLKNQVYDDISFKRVLKLFVPASVVKQAEPDLVQLGDEVLADQIFSYISDAERNQPSLRGNGRDAFGKPRSELVLTEGWRKLQEFGLRKGAVAFNYDTDYGQFTRVLQQLRLHIWEGSAANVTCPSAMHDGAARLLQMHLAKDNLDPTSRKIFQNAFDHLISRDPEKAWTSGQWMTERTGGSDVSLTETTATRVAPEASAQLADPAEDIPLGPWEINGFKWFSSATDCSMTVLLARTRPDGGLSAFYAPMWRHDAALVSATGRKGGRSPNGVRISRLKNKFGTQSLPTAELELRGMRGWLIGQEGRGIQEIATILTITRVHSTVAALGYLGRGLAVARAYARVREVGAGGGRRVPLCRSPLHMRTLAALTGEYHGLMLLTYYTTYLLGLSERGSSSSSPQPLLAGVTPPAKLVAPLLRVLSSLHKSYCCKRAIPALFACMEALGGVGYLLNAETEHMNVARLFRDACVLPIWEGTTDVLASDCLRAMKHPASGGECLAALGWFVEAAAQTVTDGDGARAAVLREWKALEAKIRRERQEVLLPEARDIVFRLAEILIALLLEVDAASDGAPEARVISRRFMVKTGFLTAEEKDGAGARGDLDMDSRIVYGGDESGLGEASISKL